MPNTVSEGFSTLLERIAPLAAEVEARASHAKVIRQALVSEFGDVSRLELIGSHTRRTAIRGYSDVDFLAVLKKRSVTRGESLVQPSTVLGRVKNALEDRLSGYGTRLGIRGPSVTIEFSQGPVDVVPGFYNGTTALDGYPVFAIPDAMGAWQDTSPQRHGKFIKEENERSRYTLSPTIRLLKRWKYSRNPAVPCLGFHIELLLAKEAVCVGARKYGECLLDAFRLIRDRDGSQLNDPLGISGRIPAVYTDAQASSLYKAAAYAADHAARAVDAEEGGNVDEAYRQWQIVYNQEFPARR